MTKDQFELRKQEIINLLGKPEYDMKDAVNESARQLVALRTEYRLGLMAEGRQKAKEKGQKQKPETLQEINAEVPSEKLKEYSTQLLPSVLIEDKDLVMFSDLEKEILRARYDNWNMDTKKLADRFGMSRQKVAALLNSIAVQILDAKVWKQIVPFEVRKSLMSCLRAHDVKVTLRLAEHEKIIENEKLDLTVRDKAITDPAAIKMLKELGDRLTTPTEGQDPRREE